MITERQRQILNMIISLYSKEHTPVGSKALLGEIKASSATIRNDMKMLETMGLIQKEHTSSGRVPSTEGYKYFVEHVLHLEEINQSDLFQIMKSFDGDFFRISDLFNIAAESLSEMTGLTAFVLNVPQARQSLSNFELVGLDSHSMLAVITLNTGEVRTNQFILPRALSEKDLTLFRQIARERFLDKTVLDIHYALRTEIPQIVQKYFSKTTDILKVFETVFEDLFKEKLVSRGRQRIFDYASGNFPELYRFFSNDDLMIQELREFTNNDEMRAVKFDHSESLGNLTLLSQKFIIPYRGLGTLALVGPVEMDYQKALSILDLLAKVLTMKLTDYYRYLDGNHYEISK